MKTFYIGSGQSYIKLGSKLDVNVRLTRELTIDEIKQWEDDNENLLTDLYQSEGEELHSVDEIVANDKLGYLITTELYHPLMSKDVKETDDQLYPDCQDKFWRELKYYIVIN